VSEGLAGMGLGRVALERLPYFKKRLRQVDRPSAFLFPVQELSTASGGATTGKVFITTTGCCTVSSFILYRFIVDNRFSSVPFHRG
jgi:hypothetical protein